MCSLHCNFVRSKLKAKFVWLVAEEVCRVERYWQFGLKLATCMIK